MEVKTFQRAVTIGIVVLLTSSTGWAQGMNVALLDVGFIFKNHPGFKQQMDGLKAKVAKFEEGLKAKQQEIQAAGKQLTAFKPGSPQYKEIEAKTTKQLADLKVQTQLQRKAIMEEEAKIYLSTYKNVYSVVESYAKQYRIDLVLRYDRETGENSGDPRETLKLINRPVIYNVNLDISSAILERIGGVASRPNAPLRK